MRIPDQRIQWKSVRWDRDVVGRLWGVVGRSVDHRDIDCRGMVGHSMVGHSMVSYSMVSHSMLS